MTVESTTGEVFRGKLIEAEDNMNLQVRMAYVADFRPERADSRPERADFRPERAWGDVRTNG